MLRKLMPRSVYDVMAAIACFGVLAGGTAYAANTVFSSDIVDGEVKAPDIGANAVDSARVRDQTLNTFDVHTFLGADVVDNTLTGADVDESTLDLAAEPWHEPELNRNGVDFGSCWWRNYPSDHNSAALFRDRSGVVHLKGLVVANDGHTWVCGTYMDGTFNDARIFYLPHGYLPARREVHVTLANGALGRVNVDPTGGVTIDSPTTFDNAEQWLSLDGISWRCAPSGENGCP